MGWAAQARCAKKVRRSGANVGRRRGVSPGRSESSRLPLTASKKQPHSPRGPVAMPDVVADDRRLVAVECRSPQPSGHPLPLTTKRGVGRIITCGLPDLFAPWSGSGIRPTCRASAGPSARRTVRALTPVPRGDRPLTVIVALPSSQTRPPVVHPWWRVGVTTWWMVVPADCAPAPVGRSGAGRLGASTSWAAGFPHSGSGATCSADRCGKRRSLHPARSWAWSRPSSCTRSVALRARTGSRSRPDRECCTTRRSVPFHRPFGGSVEVERKHCSQGT